MNGDAEFVEGSATVRTALLLLLVGGVALYFAVGHQLGGIIAQIEAVAADQPAVAVAMGSRLLLWLVVASGSIAMAIALYLWMLARQVAVQRRYPPAAMPIALRTRILREAAALRQARQLRWCALLVGSQPLLGLGFWLWFTGGVL